MKTQLLSLVLAISTGLAARAVQQTSGAYNTDDPLSEIPEWSTGWTQPASQPAGYTYTTGWNYVGTVGTNNASGTYLGNGWVLTAAHVSQSATTDFYLGGMSYVMVPNSYQMLSPGSAVDLALFQIVAPPALPNLTLAATDPSAYNTSSMSGGSNVAMIGYGDGGSVSTETWGYNTVTQVNQETQPTGTSYDSNDFFTATTTSFGLSNNSQLVTGDSGGGDFIYDAATGHWELAGINEVNGNYENDPTYGDDALSGFVQLDTYASAIDQITGVPEPPAWILIGVGAGGLWVLARCRRVSSPATQSSSV